MKAVIHSFRVPHLQAESVLRRMALRLDTYDLDELHLLSHYFGLEIQHPMRFGWVEYSLTKHRQRAIDSAPTRKSRLERSLQFFARRKSRSSEGLIKETPNDSIEPQHWWDRCPAQLPAEELDSYEDE